jgi:hypothetical protein
MAPLKLTLISLLAAFITSINGQFFNQSAPFNLVLCSVNATYDNSTLSACHEGAAIEALCVNSVPQVGHLSTNSISQYQLNYSSFFGPGYGYLTWSLPFTGKYLLESAPISPFDPKVSISSTIRDGHFEIK